MTNELEDLKKLVLVQRTQLDIAEDLIKQVNNTLNTEGTIWNQSAVHTAIDRYVTNMLRLEGKEDA